VANQSNELSTVVRTCESFPWNKFKEMNFSYIFVHTYVSNELNSMLV